MDADASAGRVQRAHDGSADTLRRSGDQRAPACEWFVTSF